MNLRKLLMLVTAAMAFAIPASASATEPVFTHEGGPIPPGQTKTVSFKGPAGFVLLPVPSIGFHCKNVTINLILKSGSTGTVESFETNITGETQCTTTPDNFVTHTEPTGLPWTVHATTGSPDTLSITGVDFHNYVTHPMTPCVIATRRVTGNVDATIPAGQTTDIKTVTLSGPVIFHAGSQELEAEVFSGTLIKEGTTQVGVQ